ncbi:hypothetical protein MINTM021_10950 [Mycobacterium paraintracellulare]|nr:hypothetical protein MINTM021_10950 [Mycobacterium paraintracellulare]
MAIGGLRLCPRYSSHGPSGATVVYETKTVYCLIVWSTAAAPPVESAQGGPWIGFDSSHALSWLLGQFPE